MTGEQPPYDDGEYIDKAFSDISAHYPELCENPDTSNTQHFPDQQTDREALIQSFLREQEIIGYLFSASDIVRSLKEELFLLDSDFPRCEELMPKLASDFSNSDEDILTPERIIRIERLLNYAYAIGLIARHQLTDHSEVVAQIELQIEQLQTLSPKDMAHLKQANEHFVNNGSMQRLKANALFNNAFTAKYNLKNHDDKVIDLRTKVVIAVYAQSKDMLGDVSATLRDLGIPYDEFMSTVDDIIDKLNP